MDIYQALERDHDRLMDLLGQLISLTDVDEERREEILKEIRGELHPHSRAEEAAFYDRLRRSGEGQSAVSRSGQEHETAEDLLKRLEESERIDADWKITALKLKSTLEKHIAEEETLVFETARRILSDDEAARIGEEFERRKEEARGNFLSKILRNAANLLRP